MSGAQLSVVTYYIFVSRILYALPAWGGFLSAELTNKINAIFRRLERFGYTTCNITVSDLIDTSGRDFFCKLCSSEHSLHHLLPPERKYSNLRNRGHPYQLPEYCTNLYKKSYHSIIVFVHLIFYFNICELSFNRDLAHCWRAFDMSNNITYLLTYLLTYLFSSSSSSPPQTGTADIKCSEALSNIHQTTTFK